MAQQRGSGGFDRRHPPPPGPRPLTFSLAAAARRLGAEDAMDVAALSAGWAELVGDAVADHTRPVSVRNGVLTVVADHHAWGAQLRLLSFDLVKKVQVMMPKVQMVSVYIDPSGPSGLVK